MTKIGDAYPSKYLKADDFQGRPNVTLTVKAAPLEDSFGEKKVVLYFYETNKAFTLSPTNARIIMQFLEDDETDRWTGAKVTLTPVKRQIAGQVKQVIDVTAAWFPQGRAEMPVAGQQADAFGGPPPPSGPSVAGQDDIPF